MSDAHGVRLTSQMDFHTLSPMLRRALAGLALVLVITSCGGSDEAKGPTATIPKSLTTESTTTTSKPSTPEEEVEAAYLKSWDVYTRAKRRLDPAGLDCCYAGEQLKRTQADIETYRRRNAPTRTRVDHDYQIQLIAPDVAVVTDSYRNHTVLLNPDSGIPIEDDPNDMFVEIYTLRKLEGQWKVTDIVRGSQPSS